MGGLATSKRGFCARSLRIGPTATDAHGVTIDNRSPARRLDSVRAKLYAGFAVVSAALLVAVGVGWMSMLSVSSSVQTGYQKAVTAQATSKWAYNMRVSQAQSAAIGHAIKNADGSNMHASDMATYAREFNHLAAMARTQDDHAAIARITAADKKWRALDHKVTSLTNAGQN